jgi:diadenosine tetraphosphate (Ap4A) HIT family hydrolase
MIVPHRHVEIPFKLNYEERSEVSEALSSVKSRFDFKNANGFTVGWNVGAVAGQDVFHTHLHVIAQFSGELSEGLGNYALFRHLH